MKKPKKESSAQKPKDKASPSSVKKPKSSTAKSPKLSSSVKSPKETTKAEVKSESPENKPENGQSKNLVVEDKKDEGKTLKIQSAGAGQAGADYNPSRKKYHPINDAFWKRGEK